jgi:multidrug efflux system membrane fusion protein
VSATAQNGTAPLAEGKLSFVNNAVDTSTGTITLKATFPNQNRVLWPGQFVNVALTLEERPNAITIPSVAVQNGQRGPFVYVVKQDKSVEMRPVQVAESTQALAIVSNGLTAGETVVTDGQLRLTPKSKVEIKGSAE